MHQFWVRLAGAARVLLLGLEHFAALRECSDLLLRHGGHAIIAFSLGIDVPPAHTLGQKVVGNDSSLLYTKRRLRFRTSTSQRTENFFNRSRGAGAASCNQSRPARQLPPATWKAQGPLSAQS